MRSTPTFSPFLTPDRVIWPGLAISVTVLSVNFLGAGLRDALDPHATAASRGDASNLFRNGGHHALLHAPSSTVSVSRSDRRRLLCRLDCGQGWTHIVHMKQIGIRELHLKTGEWVRSVALGEGVVITDRGRPVASLLPVCEPVT